MAIPPLVGTHHATPNSKPYFIIPRQRPLKSSVKMLFILKKVFLS